VCCGRFFGASGEWTMGVDGKSGSLWWHGLGFWGLGAREGVWKVDSTRLETCEKGDKRLIEERGRTENEWKCSLGQTCRNMQKPLFHPTMSSRKSESVRQRGVPIEEHFGTLCGAGSD